MHDDRHSTNLEYSTTRAPRMTSHHVLVAALILATAPLVLGCASTVLFAVTGADEFALGGFLALILGVFCVAAVIGLVISGRHLAKREKRDMDDVGRRVSRVLFVTLANFPAAVVCALIGGHFMHYVVVSVTNASNLEIADVRLDFAGNELAVGRLAPGQRWEKRLGLLGGPGIIRWTASGRQFEHQFADHVDGDTVSYRPVEIQIAGDSADWNHW